MGSSLEEVIMSFECRCVDFEVTLRHLGWGGGGDVKQVVGCRGLDI